jgi:aminotransferase
MGKINKRIADKAAQFTESVIREMTRLAQQHEAINLAQGFPNFAAPQFIKDAACDAIQADINQYSITWGAQSLRNSVSKKYSSFYGWDIDPEKEITVCCGATECMIASILALINPGERVLVFEPFYENYGPDAVIAGASPLFFPLDPDSNWSFDPEQLEQVISRQRNNGGIRALILNSPNNPTGKVFSLEELNCLADLARRYDFYVITDEIYEHIIYDGHRHYPIALLPGMKDRTITISGMSKTFSVTGWRVGYIIAPHDLTNAIRKMHDFISVGAAAPLQEAAARALTEDTDYFQRLSSLYVEKRDFTLEMLEQVGFRAWKPYGAYYVMADISPVTDLTDVAFARLLVEEYGVAVVPGSSFYHIPEDGEHLIRFAFCKTLGVLESAGERLLRLKE